MSNGLSLTLQISLNGRGMAANGDAFEVASALTDRYQTTIPKAVRDALQLKAKDKIRYTIRPDGKVQLRRVDTQEDEDSATAKFLEFLGQDIDEHPERLRVLSPGLLARARELTVNVKYDINEALPPDE